MWSVIFRVLALIFPDFRFVCKPSFGDRLGHVQRMCRDFDLGTSFQTRQLRKVDPNLSNVPGMGPFCQFFRTEKGNVAKGG